ncbi:MAG: dethiobiotin synthase [Gammaproteobacteria bacterium]|nr:dethiobiotin synthase [Gammaproteobacteria bacterium]
MQSEVRGWFITGTDTGVGKTRVSCLLLEALAREGKPAVGMKPVASGCRVTAAGPRSEDAEMLLAASDVVVDYADVNPYAFVPAIAPLLAAHETGVDIRLEKILESFQRLQRAAPWIVVEGVGGWKVPLSEGVTTADVARALRLPVILVVGLRLGCLNHALLTAAAVERDGMTLAGWIANQIDPAMTHAEENVVALRERIEAPLLARFPYRNADDRGAPPPAFEHETIMHLTSMPGRI